MPVATYTTMRHAEPRERPRRSVARMPLVWRDPAVVLGAPSQLPRLMGVATLARFRLVIPTLGVGRRVVPVGGPDTGHTGAFGFPLDCAQRFGVTDDILALIHAD